LTQNAIKAKIDLVSTGKNKENPTQQRRQELIAQANEIRKKQGVGKNARNAKLDEIKRLDEQLRSRIAEQKAARAKVPFKSVEEIEQKIAGLERDVNSGTMKIVDEKKALDEISRLRKLGKTFSQFDNSQKAIDDLKAKIKEIKDSMEDPEAKALNEQYNQIQAELDAIKAEQSEAYNNRSALFAERDKLRAAQEETWQALKKHKDEYYTQRKAYQAWEREQREKRREREQAERERIAKERKMERAKAMLAEASEPAFLEEIRRANSLLRFFDPTHQVVEKTPLLADKGLAATVQRKVDDSGLQGMRVLRKEDRDDEYMPAVKKGKKGKGAKKTEAPVTASSKFSCPPSVMEDCAFIGVNPPMSAAEVPDAMEKIKAKLEQWKADQPEQTRKVSYPQNNSPLTVLSSSLTFAFRTLKRPRRRLSALRPRKPVRRRPAQALRPMARTERRRPTRQRLSRRRTRQRQLPKPRRWGLMHRRTEPPLMGPELSLLSHKKAVGTQGGR
jgi:uncharacterized coiled-coil DUF342 family protein